MPQDQLPRISDLLAPGVTALVALKPKAARHIYAGKWGNIVRGLGAQAEIARAYLSSEIKAGSLQAEGQALVEYLRSEFFATLDTEPSVGVGEATLTRTLVNAESATNALTPGVIRAGTRLARAGNQATTPAIESSEYETLQDAVFGPDDDSTTESNGEFTHVQSVTVPVRAPRAGLHSSTLRLVGGSPQHTATIGGSLFEVDSVWTATVYCAGGRSEVEDEGLRQLAPHLGQGVLGPTGSAAMAGALSCPGVRYAAYRSNLTSGQATVFCADAAWGWSSAFEERVLSYLEDNEWLGFGARVRVRGVWNQPTVVRPTVMVRNELLVSDKSSLVATLQQAARDYFDQRPDWYTWRLETLRAALTAASRQVLTVPSVTVTTETGVTLSEPPSEIADGSSFATHYYVVGLEPTFVSPS